MISTCDIAVYTAFKYGVGAGVIPGIIVAGLIIYLMWKK